MLAFGGLVILDTVAADVYSLGICIWEMWTGAEPYAELGSMFEVQDRVREGYRLAIPPDMPPALSQIVTLCWHRVASSRPTMCTVSKCLALPDVLSA